MNEPYFLQTKEWTDFWLGSMEKGHNIIKVQIKEGGVTAWAFLYKYPWFLNQNFLYIPKGPIFEGKDLTKKKVFNAFRAFVVEVVKINKDDSTFVKIELDDAACEILNLEEKDDVQAMMKNLVSPDGKNDLSGIEVVESSRNIQYLSTMTLELEGLGEATKDSEVDLAAFFEDSKDFWSKTNQKIRRYTRKSFGNNWGVSFEKSQENFENFWKIYSDTSKRQKFATHKKEYFEELFTKDFSKLITLKDSDGKVQCSWFGVVLGNTIYYLYGGNTQKSFDNYGQYLVHVAATYLGKSLGVKYYDLGGYDPEKGFGKFKEGYRGVIRHFGYPMDLALQPRKYHFTNRFVQTAKTFRDVIPFL